MHVGTIVEVKDFPEARKPAYQLTIDFGETIEIEKLHKLPNATQG
jgi:tRNA-binding protein